jgi:hypothetical protein
MGNLLAQRQYHEDYSDLEYLFFLSCLSYKTDFKLSANHYISEKYLFVVALNVGYLKRFAGL